jgi:hypothetical protein
MPVMNSTAPRGIPLRPDPFARDREQSRSINRAITAITFSSQERSAEAHVAASWPDDSLARRMAKDFGVVEQVTKAVVIPTTLQSSGLPAVVAVNILPSIAPKSVAVQLFARCMQINLGRKTEVLVPRGVPGVSSIFIAEGGAIPVIRLNFTPSTIGPSKKNIAIGRLIEEDATRSLDGFTFDAAADDGVRPAGLLHGLSSLTPSAGSGLDAISKDVANLAGSIADARISAADMILVCNPRQAVQLKAVVGPKFDYLVLDTPMVPNHRVIGLAPARIASAYSGIPNVEKVPSAVIQFEDTNPQNIVDAEGNVGAPAQSTFQNDMIGIRIRCRAAWSVVAAGGVAYIDNVSW